MHVTDFLRLLHERTAQTEERDNGVTTATTVNTFLVTNATTLLDVKDDVEDGDEKEEGVTAARLAQCLRVATVRVARHEVRHDADTQVAETAQQAVTPFAHSDL